MANTIRILLWRARAGEVIHRLPRELSGRLAGSP
jgi:hypothetical protein